MKSYTDIPQSKKLAEILPIESADMCYIKHSSSDNPTWEFNEDFPPMILGDVPINEITAETLPCWSLAALMAQMPCVELVSSQDNHYRAFWHEMYSEWHESAVDACVELIERMRKEEEQ